MKMGPEKLAKELRRIAAAIDNSKKPSRELVARAIREVIAALDPKDYEHITDQSVQDEPEVAEMRKVYQQMKDALADFEAAIDKLGGEAAA
jgi:hypothetical protein